jgi:TetR/AcrR family transcriptional regulator, transcriptional repressor for nem operon
MITIVIKNDRPVQPEKLRRPCQGISMRVSKADAENNRARMVAAAGKQLRARGIDGVGVDALAKAAGLTHGSVYSHFKSKDELAAAAIAHALQTSFREWMALTEGLAPDQAFRQMIRVYVSRYHRDTIGEGCSIATLGAGAGRGGRKLRSTFASGVEGLIGMMTAASNKVADKDRRAQAVANVAAMVGAIVMARAAGANQELSDEILKTVRAELLK